MAMAGAGLELTGVVLALTLGGWWLDTTLNTLPWFVISGLMVTRCRVIAPWKGPSSISVMAITTYLPPLVVLKLAGSLCSGQKTSQVLMKAE